jgi:hypothetical protein
MVINIETWNPDTCRCQLTLAWDDSTTTPTYSGVSIIKDAPHLLLLDSLAIQCVMSENALKSDALGTVFSTFSGNPSVVGGGHFFGYSSNIGFAPGISFNYQFQGLAPSRQIQITLAGAPLTTTDNTTLQADLNAMSGAPVVLVSGGTLPVSGIVVSPIPISGSVVTPTSAGT